MDYENLCKRILDIDKNIRFAAVYDANYVKVAGGMRPGKKSFVPDEITNRSATNAFLRKNTRIKMKGWIGLPKYAMAEYEKVKRFSFYLPYDHILLVSTETNTDTNVVINSSLELIDQLEK